MWYLSMLGIVDLKGLCVFGAAPDLPSLWVSWGFGAAPGLSLLWVPRFFSAVSDPPLLWVPWVGSGCSVLVDLGPGGGGTYLLGGFLHRHLLHHRLLVLFVDIVMTMSTARPDRSDCSDFLEKFQDCRNHPSSVWIVDAWPPPPDIPGLK